MLLLFPTGQRSNGCPGRTAPRLAAASAARPVVRSGGKGHRPSSSPTYSVSSSNAFSWCSSDLRITHLLNTKGNPVQSSHSCPKSSGGQTRGRRGADATPGCQSAKTHRTVRRVESHRPDARQIHRVPLRIFAAAALPAVGAVTSRSDIPTVTPPSSAHGNLGIQQDAGCPVDGGETESS